ncbi:CAPR2 protein, partial [Polyodon spathula]|nr:CAPR2 protein [Polyodon spathula]
MVQLSPSPIPCLSPTEQADDGKMTVKAEKKQGSPKSDAQPSLTSLQLALSASTTTYQGYDTYIEDGLICLKHKIRNIEKKKIKLEDYRQRLKEGELLNQDQLEAVEKYDEVIHNLAFAKELQKTFGSLSQELLKAQKKAVRREQVLKIETEKRRLRTILQVQYILQNLQEEHVRKDFRSGLNGALFLSARELDYLLKFSKLASLMRDEQMSLEDQMEQATSYLWELLEGGEKVVVGTTYKHLKAQMAKLMDCGYFDHIPVPQSKMLEEVKEVHKVVEVMKTEPLSKLLTEGAKELVKVPGKQERYLPETDFHSQGKTKTLQPWKADFAATKQEPPDSWEMQFDDSRTTSPQPVPTKQGRPAAGLVAKAPVESKVTATSPKPMPKPIHSPIAVFNSTSSLPKDPALRRQKLQDLMAQIQGSFSFMQDSVLECESSPVSAMPLLTPLSVLASSTPIVFGIVSKSYSVSQRCPNSILAKTILPALGLKTNTCTSHAPLIAIKQHFTVAFICSFFLSPLSPAQMPLLCEEQMPLCNDTISTPELQTQAFQSPPTSNHTLSMSAAPFQAMHTAFKVNASLPPRDEPDMKPESYNQSHSTASTQTTPQCSSQPAYTLDQNALPHETLQPGKTSGFVICWSICGSVMELGFCFIIHQGFIIGGASVGFDGYRGGIHSPCGNYTQQSYPAREYTTMLYGSREAGYQQNYKRGGGPAGQKANSRGWSDSSQVSSPERDHETFNSVDSGQGDSRCITPIDIPVTSQATTLMPVHVYPLPPQMRVAFSAARTSNFTPGTLDQTISFDLLLNNLGETFEMHMGRFSCPVNGTYVFIFHMLKLAVNVPLYVNLMKNEEVLVSAYANDGAPDHETASNHAVLQLYQGDQIWLRLHRGAIYGSSWKYSTFSGYLLYQD